MIQEPAVRDPRLNGGAEVQRYRDSGAERRRISRDTSPWWADPVELTHQVDTTLLPTQATLAASQA